MFTYITKLILVLFSSTYECVAGSVNHPRFTNSSWFKKLAPTIIVALFTVSGLLTSHLLQEMEKVDSLEKQLQELKLKSLAPSEEQNKNVLLLTTCTANLKAAGQRYLDLEGNYKLLQQEVITLRERLIKQPTVPEPTKLEPQKKDILIESSNRRLKRLGDKKDDSD